MIRSDHVLERFSRAAPTYENDAVLQQAMAWRLAQLTCRLPIPPASGLTWAAAPVISPRPWKRVTPANRSCASMGVPPCWNDIPAGLAPCGMT